MTFAAIFLGIFFLIGIGLLSYGLITARRSLAAGNWPRAMGTITRCELISNTDGEGGTTEQIKVEYTYKIGAKSYAGSRLAFGYSNSSARAGNAELVDRLKSARSVEVRYDPTNPANSTLSYGIHRSIQSILAFAAIWLVFVSGFALIVWVMSRRDDVLLRNLITH